MADYNSGVMLKMSGTVTIHYWIRTDKQGSECADTLEMDKAEWESMTEQEQEEYMREVAFDSMEWNYGEV